MATGSNLYNVFLNLLL